MTELTIASKLTFNLSLIGTLAPHNDATGYQVRVNLADERKPLHLLVFMRHIPIGDAAVQLYEWMTGGWMRELKPLQHPFTRSGTPQQFEDDFQTIRQVVQSLLLNHELHQVNLRGGG